MCWDPKAARARRATPAVTTRPYQHRGLHRNSQIAKYLRRPPIARTVVGAWIGVALPFTVDFLKMARNW